MNDEAHELETHNLEAYKQHRTAQEKYPYFVLAAVGVGKISLQVAAQ